MRTNLPRAVRALRLHRGWRQEDLAARAGVSHQLISRIERGRIDGITPRSLQAIVAALDATLDMRVAWRGAELDRLVDSRHAGLQDDVARLLTARGWDVRAEVSFNHFGDRGRVDLVARHPRHGHLLVVEVKTEIGDLQETLGRLDIKARLSPRIADTLGWPGATGIPALVMADARATRRVVATHAALFARFTLRGRSAMAWLSQPSATAPSGLLWFVNRPDARGVRVTSAGRARKRANSPGA